ncbi:MAG: DNA translocase FtsK [Anaerolineae bacterium]
MVKQQVLEAQASRIEQVLASHKIAARVWGGRVTPRYVQFHVTTTWGTRLSRVVNLSEEIAMALGARNCRIQRRNGALEIEVPLEGVRGVSFLSVLKQVRHVPPHTALLGVDEANHPLFVRLPSPEVAHILVAGTTGCGKTALLRSMILSLALGNRRSALQMVLIDPKKRGFAPLAGLPHLLRPILCETSETLDTLQALVQEMLRRDRQGRSEPRIAVFVDELADLAQEGGSSCAELLTRLAQRGREAGIHLVVGTQKPTSSIAGPLFKSNFPVRLVGRVASPEDARVAAGIGGTGAERLLGRGDFLAVASGEVIRFQSAYADAEELRFIVRHLGSGGRWEGVRALCLQAEPEEAGKAIQPGPVARRLFRWEPLTSPGVPIASRKGTHNSEEEVIGRCSRRSG